MDIDSGDIDRSGDPTEAMPDVEEATVSSTQPLEPPQLVAEASEPIAVMNWRENAGGAAPLPALPFHDPSGVNSATLLELPPPPPRPRLEAIDPSVVPPKRWTPPTSLRKNDPTDARS